MSREAHESQAIRSEESWTEAFLVDFPERLATTRNQRGMTQQALADAVGIHREREVVGEFLEGMLIKHDAEQWMRSKQAAGAE